MSKQPNAKAPKHIAESEPVPGEKPSPQAWVAFATVDHEGRRCDVPKDDTLTIVAVSVHEQYPTDVNERIELMHRVVDRFKSKFPSNVSSLWVFPAGYFGFDAAAYANNNGNNAWWKWDPKTLEDRVSELVKPFPVGAWIAFGVDYPAPDLRCMQEVWLVQRKQAEPVPRKITREYNPEKQCVDLDNHGFKAAFFVCNEVKNYGEDFKDCRIVVDLAHIRVPGTVRSNDEGARMVHERALRAAGTHGAAMLAHHHTGQTTAIGSTHFRHQSNWILFRGAEPNWLSAEEVLDVP